MTQADVQGAVAPITSTASRSWRDVLAIHPAANKIPEASDSERRGLAGDLARHGLKVPVVLVRVAGGPPQLLDGRHRLDLLEGTGIKVVGDDVDMLVPHQIVDVADDAEAECLSLSLNAHRRHLPTVERRRLLQAQLKATPEKSDRAIGAIVGYSDKTVAKERRDLEGRSEIPNVEIKTDTKGRKQPVKKASRKAEPAAKKAAVSAPASAETPRELVADDEKLALLSEFARFVIERATAIRFEPKDHAEYKVLRGCVEQVIGGGK
jgi:ParB-like chromosome segregation protein Spo0J